MTRHDTVLVLYPRGIRTGGPEALHQLVDSLRRQGQDAYLVPTPDTAGLPRVPDYAAYDAPEADFVDSPGVALVVPEPWLGALAGVRRATRYCWWLSIDNAGVFAADWRDRDAWRPIAQVPPPQQSEPIDWELMRSVHHLTQSQYAWSYLCTRTGVTGSMLSDYTDAERFAGPVAPPEARGRTVAYNPAKSGLIVETLAMICPDVTFVPLAGMSPAEIARTLGASAVYLDLGHHPGKDRLPREAALAGAIVLVARRGSAAYHVDVPLPAEHRLPATVSMIEDAADAVRTVLADPVRHLEAQQAYRARVAVEREVFDAEVRAVFGEGRLGDDGTVPRRLPALA